MLVLYWYQAHGRIVPSEYWAKIFLVKDAIQLKRTDGALVRIMVPLDSPNGETQGEAEALAFAQRILPLLDSYIPR
jgi:EpsI family protein